MKNQWITRRVFYFVLLLILALFASSCDSPEKEVSMDQSETLYNEADFIYSNELVKSKGVTLFKDWPEYVQPLKQDYVYTAPELINDPGADLLVKAFRYSYNARGVVIVPNKLNGKNTAIIVVHPWGVDDNLGYSPPEPAGIALFCTPEKNKVYQKHVKDVLVPFLDAMRDHVRFVGYSLTGTEDEIRKTMYKSIDNKTINTKSGLEKFKAFKNSKNLMGKPVIRDFKLSRGRRTLLEYFNIFVSTDSSSHYNGEFWEVPMPMASAIKPGENDFVIYDGDGYPKLRDYLVSQGIKNILLCGYATDMCLVSTTAGYMNLRNDFNVFIVGDATLATFPAQDTPAYATAVALTNASLSNFVTQISWIDVQK